MKKALPFGIVLVLMILSFIGCQNGGSPNLLSTWAGTYAGGTSGTIPTWKFYDDNTMEGVWEDSSGSFSLNVSGTFTLNGSTFTFTASGEATNPYNTPTTNTFTVSGSGTLGSATGNGSYSITFSSWSSYSGTWSLTKQ